MKLNDNLLIWFTALLLKILHFFMCYPSIRIKTEKMTIFFLPTSKFYSLLFIFQETLTVPVKTNVWRLYASAPGRKLVEWRDAPPTEPAYFAVHWLSTRKLVSTCIADVARISALSAWSLEKAAVGSVEAPVLPALWHLCRPWFLESKEDQKQSCSHCLNCPASMRV